MRCNNAFRKLSAKILNLANNIPSRKAQFKIEMRNSTARCFFQIRAVPEVLI